MHQIHIVILAMFAVGPHDGPPIDLTTLTRDAEAVVVATVTRVDPVFQTNEFGDELIVSHTHLRVDDVLKKGGWNSPALVLELEGGTIGELTLHVSDLPRLERGNRAVVFLRRNTRGAIVPHGRGRGILILDSSDRVKGRALTLSAVRQAVQEAR